MLPQSRSYEALARDFRWQIPAQFNIGVEVCDRWAARDPGKLALIAVAPDGQSHDVSYGWLRETSNRLANALAANGIKRGDRVAILLPQAPEVAAIHIAIYKIGAIALPLAVLFGPDALAYRLQNAGAKALITNAQGLAKITEIKIAEIKRTEGAALAGLELILSVDGPGDGALDFAKALERASADFTPVATAADDPAMMIYTSGTTASPWARCTPTAPLGQCRGSNCPQFFQPGDARTLAMTSRRPADCLPPSLYCGVPVVACRFDKFDPEEAFAYALACVRLHPADAALRAVPNPQALRHRRLVSPAARLAPRPSNVARPLGVSINAPYGPD